MARAVRSQAKDPGRRAGSPLSTPMRQSGPDPLQTLAGPARDQRSDLSHDFIRSIEHKAQGRFPR